MRRSACPDQGPIRQIAVTGLGRENPTLFLCNSLTTSAREIVIRYAGEIGVEDGLGTSVNFFHFDCSASEVRLNVDLDAALTVVANGCYRWLGRSFAATRMQLQAALPPLRRTAGWSRDPAQGHSGPVRSTKSQSRASRGEFRR